jgi:hypothetical protein
MRIPRPKKQIQKGKPAIRYLEWVAGDGFKDGKSR